MKKSILTLLILAFATFTFAQKPIAKDLAVEAGFNLSSMNSNFTLPSLRFRYFIMDDLAGRLDLGVTSNSNTRYVAENMDGTGEEGEAVNSNSNISIGLGVEKHLGGNGKFSPYYGGQFNYSMGSSSSENTNLDRNRYRADYSMVSESSISSLGIMAITGADYWIANSFYLGAELMFGYTSTTNGETTETVTTGGVEQKTVVPGRDRSILGQSINPSFRIGFLLK